MDLVKLGWEKVKEDEQFIYWKRQLFDASVKMKTTKESVVVSVEKM